MGQPLPRMAAAAAAAVALRCHRSRSARVVCFLCTATSSGGGSLPLVAVHKFLGALPSLVSNVILPVLFGASGVGAKEGLVLVGRPHASIAAFTFSELFVVAAWSLGLFRLVDVFCWLHLVHVIWSAGDSLRSHQFVVRLVVRLSIRSTVSSRALSASRLSRSLALSSSPGTSLCSHPVICGGWGCKSPCESLSL